MFPNTWFLVENEMEKEYLFVKIEGLKREDIVKIEFCVMPIIGSHNIVAIPLQMLCKIVANYNHAVCVSKVPWLRVESMALLGAKPHGYGWEMRAEGWMISPTRLRHFPESTRRRRGVDSYTYNQSTRRND